MAKYEIVFSSRVDKMLMEHISFLARVSLPAARRLRIEFEETLKHMAENPYLFPVDTDLNLPENMYRKALFAKRYKALFMVEGQTVYLDAVIDCRQDTKV